MMHAPNHPLDPVRLRYPLLASEKLDGFRLVIIGDTLLTKTARDHANVNLRAHFAELLALSRLGWVFDCECYSPRLTLPQLQSILQSKTAPVPEHVHAYVFDCLSIGEWFSRRVSRFERRLARLEILLVEHCPARTRPVPHYRIDDQAALMQLYRDTIDAGGEGLMLRTPVGGYHHGRVPVRKGMIWKMKPGTVADGDSLDGGSILEKQPRHSHAAGR